MVNSYIKQEVYHHGIKGQQWGVRRFQNEDGTLTEEGKERYNDSSVSKKRYTTAQKSIATGSAFVAAAASTFAIRKLATGQWISEGWAVRKGTKGIHMRSSKGKDVAIALLAGSTGALTVNTLMSRNEKSNKEGFE